MDKQEYNAKVAWFRRYRQAVAKEERLRQRLAEQRGRSMGTASLGSGVYSQTAIGASGIERAVERIERAEGALLDQMECRKGIYAEILRAILRLKDTNQRRVLRYRYLNGMPVNKIAEQLHISRQWVLRLHRQAIMALDSLHLTKYN